MLNFLLLATSWCDRALESEAMNRRWSLIGFIIFALIYWLIHPTTPYDKRKDKDKLI